MCWKKSNIWDGSFISRVHDSNRLAHAYIFLGQDQQKKYWTAQSLAKRLFCKSKQDDYCDICQSCRQIEKGVHQDIFILRPFGAARVIKIETVRRLQSFLSLKSVDGSKKIGIIIDADRMRPDAANAMLKTIEEPPDNSLIILISDDIEKILSTIVSRCQQIYFPVSPREVIVEFLINEYEFDKSKSEMIADISRGNFTYAIRYSDNERREWRDCVLDSVFDLFDEKHEFLSLADEFESKISNLAKKAVLNDPRYTSADPSDDDDLDEKEKKAIEKSLYNEEVSDFFQFLESLCRDIIVFKETETESQLINLDKCEKIKKVAYKYDFDTLNEIQCDIQKAYEGFKGNTALEFVLEILFERIQRRIGVYSK